MATLGPLGTSRTAPTKRRLLPDVGGLPFATLIVLLTTALAVSLLSTYDEEARWLRLGTLLFAAGSAMWLPYGWAAVWAAGISLVTAFARGGFTDTGVLRTETLLEAPGVALTALLTVWLRRQIESLLAEPDQGSDPLEARPSDAALEPALAQPAAPPMAEPWASQRRIGVRGVRLAASEESRVFLARARAGLANLQAELAGTRDRISDTRARLWSA